MDTWGSCNETCPLVGPMKVLGNKIDELRGDVVARVGANTRAVPAVLAAAPALT